MLDLYKKVLKKVSFDRKLFKKELAKSLKYLRHNEKMMLKVWCLSTFGHIYYKEITEVFGTISSVLQT